jgi:hypothetical protein
MRACIHWLYGQEETVAHLHLHLHLHPFPMRVAGVCWGRTH